MSVDPPSGPDPPYTGAGTLARVECTTIVRPSDVSKQNIVTTFFFLSSSPGPAPADWSALATFVQNAFYSTTGSGSTPWIINGGRNGQVRVYNMADARPRPERAFSSYNASSPESATLGPREVACCLSYYSARNLPRQRGRVYLGPFILAEIFERPDSILMGRCLNLGQLIMGPFTAGAINDWSHVVWSRAGASAHPVSNYWVNNVWDVHRERGFPETTRVHLP